MQQQSTPAAGSPMRMTWLLWASLFAAAASPTATAQTLQSDGHGQPEGRVRFLNIADTDFDRYSDDPSPQEQLWMRRHYWRMLAYHPYFDQRLSWYPSAWTYKDLYGIKPEWDIFDEHPEWILRDANDNLLYIPFQCSGGTCPQYAGDFGHPAYRQWWIDKAIELDSIGYAGFWIDDVNLTWRVSDGDGNFVPPIDPRTGQEMTLDDWRRSIAEFLEAIDQAVPHLEIAHNIIWYAVPTDDPSFLRQVAASDIINLERGLNDDGLRNGDGRFGVETFLAFVDLIHALGKPVVLMDYGDTRLEREYGVAGWLLVSTGQDFLANDQLRWTAPDRWWPGYSVDLGHARGNRFKWKELLRRDFDGGMVLLNQPESPNRTVSLSTPLWTLEGDLVTHVTLRERTAAILLRFPPSS